MHVFSGFSGELLPGRPTVMISAPGGGASTFLRLIAGREEPQAGDSVLYNGLPASALRLSGVNMQRLAAFHSEVEVHEPLLTTLETFQFAYDVLNARGDDAGSHRWYKRLSPSHILRGMRDRPTAETASVSQQAADGRGIQASAVASAPVTATCVYCRPKSPQDMISILDLTEAEHTLVGSNMVRGISGGQRRRVTSKCERRDTITLSRPESSQSDSVIRTSLSRARSL